MQLIELNRDLYNVEIDGAKVGSVWRNGHDLFWYAGLEGSRRMPNGRQPFLSKEDAAEAVAEAVR